METEVCWEVTQTDLRCLTLKMKAQSPLETSVAIYQSTRRNMSYKVNLRDWRY